jgi:hypothetical protein
MEDAGVGNDGALYDDLVLARADSQRATAAVHQAAYRDAMGVARVSDAPSQAGFDAGYRDAVGPAHALGLLRGVAHTARAALRGGAAHASLHADATALCATLDELAVQSARRAAAQGAGIGGDGPPPRQDDGAADDGGAAARAREAATAALRALVGRVAAALGLAGERVDALLAALNG